MMPRLGRKYAIAIETISKPIAEYQTDEYFELDLPVAPAVMVGEEIAVEGEDIAEYEGIERTTGYVMASLSLPDVASFKLIGTVPEDAESYLDEMHITKGRYIQNRGEVVLGKSAKDNLGLQVGEMRVAGPAQADDSDSQHVTRSP